MQDPLTSGPYPTPETSPAGLDERVRGVHIRRTDGTALQGASREDELFRCRFGSAGGPSCRNVLAYCARVDFDEALSKLEFERDTGRTPRGVRVYNAHPNRFLTYTVQAFEDGSALLSFEFALGEYLATKGIQVGSDEELNQFVYPRQDIRGAQDGAWLMAAIEHAEALLADVRLDRAR